MKFLLLFLVFMILVSAQQWQYEELVSEKKEAQELAAFYRQKFNSTGQEADALIQELTNCRMRVVYLTKEPL